MSWVLLMVQRMVLQKDWHWGIHSGKHWVLNWESHWEKSWGIRWEKSLDWH
jgi:hypothetical protein